MKPDLLGTKFHRPTFPSKGVQRPKLVQQLNDGQASGHLLSLVSAPAGFGKSTCVSEWLSSQDLPISWLSLDPADDDPGRFFSYFVTALQKVDKNLGGEIEGILQNGQVPPGEILITSLINDILKIDHQFILVLDDFHVIREKAILKALERLITNQPENMHLVLVTREDPPLPLARLRANNQITEIRAMHLRFSGSEAGYFLNKQMELELSDSDIAMLLDRTEGWAVGLQLAAIALKSQAGSQSSFSPSSLPDASGFIARLSGSHRYILSYLTEEVLNRQTEEIQNFLLRTSILDKLSGELCQAVVRDKGQGIGDKENDSHPLSPIPYSPVVDNACQEILDYLDRSNLFLIPLDDEGRWYRYHHLFADLLASRLKQALPAHAIQELHSRASDWLAGNGYLEDAVQHALAGKDYEKAISLLEKAARGLMFTGRVNTLRNWLGVLPEASFDAHPHLKIYQAWIDLLQGKMDLSEQAMQETDKKLSALPPSPENDQLRMELIVILCRFMAILGSSSRAIRYAQEAVSSLPKEDLASHARVQSALAIAYLLEGEAEKSELAYQECLRLAQAAGYFTLAAHTMMVMAMWQAPLGQLHAAASTFQSIIDMGLHSGQKIFFPAGQGYIGLASIYLEWNDLETAEDYLNQGMELCGQAGLDGVYTGYILKSRLCQARGDFEGAFEEINRLEQAFQRRDPTLIARQIQLRLAMGNVDGAVGLAQPFRQMLSAGLAAFRLPLLVTEYAQVILARVALAQGEYQTAIQLLDELESTAGPGKRFGRLIEVYLLKALADYKQHAGNITPAALEHFEQALELAEPEGYVLAFLEEGPAVVQLLQVAANHRTAPDRIKNYALKLLDPYRNQKTGMERIASLPEGKAPGSGVGLPQARKEALLEELVEPLSRRELEILRLISEGCSNQEIANRLVITLHTVKKHSSNIFTKLGVNSRTQAVARASQLGLL